MAQTLLVASYLSPLLTNVEHLFGKQTVKLKKDFTTVSFSILICNIGRLTQLLNFWLSFRLLLM